MDLSVLSINKLFEMLEEEIILLQVKNQNRNYYSEHRTMQARIEVEIKERINK